MRQSGSQRMGWRGALTLAVAVAAWLGAAPGARAGQIYVLSSDSNSDVFPANFGVVDTATGAYTQIAADAGGGRNLYNLAWNPTLQTFYTTRNSKIPPNSPVTLNTLGTDGVLSAALGTIDKGMYGMAYQPSSNTLFGYHYNNNEFGTVDPTNGAWSVLNNSPGWSAINPRGGRLAFHTGTLYGAANSSGDGVFGTFNTSTGAFSETTVNPVYQNMVLASDGTTLYGLYSTTFGSEQSLYTINPADGALTFVTNITGTGLLLKFTGAAVAFSDPPAVPEPGTVGLALVGAGVLGVRAWRRRGGRATA